MVRGLTGHLGSGMAHPLPIFGDFAAHNTGVSQRAYDAAHGEGSFMALPIPDLATRNRDPERYLPATAAHPNALEPYRRLPSADAPGRADLGLWNVLANPDFPDPVHQKRLSNLACGSMGKDACRNAAGDSSLLVDRAVGLFKTPGLRDLGHSVPYFHDGSADTLEDVVDFYVDVSARARAGLVRNAAPELQDMVLEPDDVAPLAAFLRALNEDYE